MMKSASDKLYVFDFLQKQDNIFYSVQGNKQAFWLNSVQFLSDKQNRNISILVPHAAFIFWGKKKSLDKQKTLLKPEGINTENVYYKHVPIEGLLKDQNNEK